MSYLTPGDQWPEHPGKDARKALKQARDLGWSFRPEAHFGRIRCPYEEHDGGCELGIWGTSKDKSGSITARKIQSALRACEKLGGGDPEAVGETASIALDRIEILVEAAERLRDSDDLRVEVEEALEDLNIDQSDDDILEHALWIEGKADLAESDAWTAAIEAEAGDPWPPGERARGLAASAAERLEELVATTDLSDLDPMFVQQIDDLRSRLGTFDL